MSDRRTRHEDAPAIRLPVTSMLDVTFQLLFFFVLNFHPMPRETAFDLALPAEERAPPDLLGRPAMPGPRPPEFPADLRVHARAGVGDRLGGMSVADAAGKVEWVDTLDALERLLADRRDGLAAKDAVTISGDGRLCVRELVRVMDACRKAGFAKVGLTTPTGARP